VASELTAIEGIGAQRARRLLRRFGSVRGVRAASLQELTAAVGRPAAERIRRYFAGDKPPPAPVL
jgi:excinuclease ABC subunit C